ncbi:MAG: RluA family pseudouridine synthase [Tannerella sp.]|jgi:23S rRNA pseudouridine1911/1915/1917 synthase|nr:RluA family pseudouridine synthase [Tannerella sp.]
MQGQTSTVKTENTLLPYLLELFGGRSRTSVKTLLKHGQVRVNGIVANRAETPLKAGDEVFIGNTREQAAFSHPMLKIVWEDDDLIVVDKKEGLLSVSTSASQERTAHHILSEYVKRLDERNRIFILHRLDRGTSGLMLFARNRKVQEYMRSIWHEIITRRTYIALVEGVPDRTEDTIVTYLAENKRMKVYCTNPQNGKEAVSHYRVTGSSGQYSLLEVELETGRKNQIRAQMEHIGHPVAGDPKYGAATDPKGRLMLHALRLFFTHPATGREMRFETRIPREFDIKGIKQ